MHRDLAIAGLTNHTRSSVREWGSAAMRRELPPFCAVRAFEASARHVSFKQAAEELCVTQSAISHQIKLLEEFLGLPLFRRGVREVVLTRGGADYFADLSRSLDQMAAATARVRDSNETARLAVCTTPAFADKWLLPRLTSLRRAHPEIELQISTSLEPADFARDGIDINILWREDNRPGLRVDRLLASSRFPVASPRLFRGRQTPAHPDDLGNFTLLHDETTADWPRWLALAGATKVNAQAGPRFQHCGLLLQAAIEAQGVAMAYKALAEADLAAGRLVRLFDIELPPAIIYYIVAPESWQTRPKIRAFRNWLLHEARSAEVKRSVAEPCLA